MSELQKVNAEQLIETQVKRKKKPQGILPATFLGLPLIEFASISKIIKKRWANKSIYELQLNKIKEKKK